MTNGSNPQFIRERVRALATVVLTRRGDLTIKETKQETGLDLHVYIDREDKPMRLVFGVLLRGVAGPLTFQNANKLLGPTIGQFQGMRHFTYPVCLFFFTMKEEQAMFSWLAEPLVKDGIPKLVHRDKAHCVALTNELIGEVVDRIVAWYDAVESVLIA